MTASAALPALLVFAKEPAPGSVKTRLAAAVGAARAAEVYRELTNITLTCAAHARQGGVVGSIELWCSPDAESPHFRGLAGGCRASLHRQGDGDLGSRMADAIGDALTRAPAAVLVGTDCPVLTVPHLARACRLLATHDAVLGPAEDGGYVLIGARRPVPMAGIRWSTPHAMADTIAGFARAGIGWATLPALWDVDDAADLARWDALRRGSPVARA